MTRDGRRRTGGWAESRNNSLKSGSVEKSEHSDEDDLPVIPDLEEAEKEDFAQRVADAPNVAVNRVDTYKELDSDLFKHAAFATLEEVCQNVSLLRGGDMNLFKQFKHFIIH